MNPPSPKIKRVTIFANFNIHEKGTAALRFADFLSDLGVTVTFHVSNREKIFRLHRHKSNFVYLQGDELYKGSDMVTVFGGDGTILDAARYAAPFNVPILGFNFGRIGYMAELEISEIELLKTICDGNYSIDERSMLSVDVLNSQRKLRNSAFALNDAVLTNGAIARLVDFELYEGDMLLSQYRADGLILSTPTGSTAYSMAAGGSIVDPRLNAICVTPICPHSLTSRPILFSDSSVLEVKNVSRREKMIHLTVDGKVSFDLYYNDIVRISKSEMKTRLIRVKNSSFYTILRAKLCTPDCM